MQSLLDPTTAGVLSLVMPGMGQLATGRPGRAIYFIVLTVIVWTISFALFGWVVHICAALDAWYRALPEAIEEPAVNPDPGFRNYVNPPSNVIPFPRPAPSGQQEYL